MATPVHELDIPTMVFNEGNVAQRFGSDVVLPSDTWIVKSLFGYAVWHYDDVTSVLRDKRWHSAAGHSGWMSSHMTPTCPKKRPNLSVSRW